jgi:uncharacterized membrane protein
MSVHNTTHVFPLALSSLYLACLAIFSFRAHNYVVHVVRVPMPARVQIPVLPSAAERHFSSVQLHACAARFGILMVLPFALHDCLRLLGADSGAHLRFGLVSDQIHVVQPGIMSQLQVPCEESTSCKLM